ncbi:MAG: hypothetical protein ACYCSB_06940 [bacterium]
MFRKFKKISVFIGITTVSMYLVLAVANTKNAFAFIVPSISGVIEAAGAMADAGSALAQAGNIVGMTTVFPAGPFGLASAPNQAAAARFKAMMNMGKSMEALAKLQVELSKVQSSVNAATNAVSDVYSAEADVTGARNSLLSNGIIMTDCQGGQGIFGSVASEQCTESTINSNISDLQGTYTDLGGQAGISGNGISSALSGSSTSQSALLSGASNFQYISENGMAGPVAVNPQSNLCQDELAAGVVTDASKCTESYQEAMNGELNKNLLVGSTEGIAQGNAEVMTGSAFSKNVSGMTGTYDQQRLDLLKMIAEENAQQLKATGALTTQIGIANQVKAAKTINKTETPVIGKPNDPIKEMQANGWYY